MNEMTSRRAVVHVPSGPESIETIDVPVVEPGPAEVRVKIAAAAIPVDLGVARGVFHHLGLVHPPDRTGLGRDFAGTVDAAGPGVELPGGTRVARFIDGFNRDHTDPMPSISSSRPRMSPSYRMAWTWSRQRRSLNGQDS